jgi:hypothetical protein
MATAATANESSRLSCQWRTSTVHPSNTNVAEIGKAAYYSLGTDEWFMKDGTP